MLKTRIAQIFIAIPTALGLVLFAYVEKHAPLGIPTTMFYVAAAVIGLLPTVSCAIAPRRRRAPQG